MEKTIQMPVSKLSYSSLTQLLRNPIIFKMKEILNIYDTPISMSGMIGRAGHEALKMYYDLLIHADKSFSRVDAIGVALDTGLKYLAEYSDNYINYGKGGSREAMLKGYSQAMDFYFSEEPEYHKILLVEERLEAELKTLEGDILPLPAVGKPDLVHQREDGGIEIIDTKFVTYFTDYETEDYIKIIQSQFMFHLLLAAKGLQADRMIFREIKRTENMKDNAGKPQVRDWVVPFNHEPYRIIFYNLYKDVVKFLSNEPIFLPNFSDPFDGEQAGLIYAQGLINADMSDVEVMHKVRDVAFVSKKFIPSRLDKVENASLLPEERIKIRLAEFGIPVEPMETKIGASVTQYRFKVSAGVRMSTIKKHKDDIALALEAKGDVRILAPIPGTSLVGVEVENKKRSSVNLAKEHLVPNTLSLPIGMDVHGECTKVALNEMPHLLIAGATGSGKSVLVHTFITALTKQMTPADMKLLLIDPKRVELSAFARKPHLFQKVVYEYEDAVKALMGLTDEMEVRYQILEKAQKKNIEEFNASKRDPKNRLPFIVVVIDEFADFIIRSRMEEKMHKIPNYQAKSLVWLQNEFRKRFPKTSKNTVFATKARLIELIEEDDANNEMNRADANIELLIVRLAQMARAVGIHLIIATQRPSSDVITGLIKANFPTRIALRTASAVDSGVILGDQGAEKLAGKGDMLFMHPAIQGHVRLQGILPK
jgi:hypothetical protein